MRLGLSANDLDMARCFTVCSVIASIDRPRAPGERKCSFSSVRC
jgi:hypothetical protein